MTVASPTIADEILELKRDRRAILLAHHYQEPEIQELADYVGDSLELARKAVECEGDVIAFCGVWFMAETAKVLNPKRIVVVPDADASCSLVESCPVEPVRADRLAHPECPQQVLDMADFIGSTSAIIRWCAESDAREFIIVTESGVRFSLERSAPGKKFYFVANENCNCSECPYMKLNTLEKLRDCLANLEPRVELSADVMRRALPPIERMLAIP